MMSRDKSHFSLKMKFFYWCLVYVAFAKDCSQYNQTFILLFDQNEQIPTEKMESDQLKAKTIYEENGDCVELLSVIKALIIYTDHAYLPMESDELNKLLGTTLALKLEKDQTVTIKNNQK